MLNGMTEKETACLTEVMLNSGDKLTFDYNIVDKNDFENYIKNVISALDGVTDISALEVAISEQIAQESIKKFLNDGQCHALLIQKTSNKGMSMFNCP